MSRTLKERRSLLRATVAAPDLGAAALADALDGADEHERASLARMLPPSRLFAAEGATPRACVALAALGKPEHVADTLFPQFPGPAERIAPHLEAAFDDLCLALAGRGDDWLYNFFDLLSSYLLRDLQWRLQRRLIRERDLAPTSSAYVSSLITNCGYRPGTPPEVADGAQIVAALRADPLLLARDFWLVFEVEGAGSNWLLTDANAAGWDDAIRQLSDEDAAFRARALTASLGALLRDFAARQIVWYPRVHRLLDPTPSEIVARQHDYLAVLGTAPSTAVGLAQDMLARVIDDAGLDADALIAASAAVLARTEKKLLKAHIALLAKLVAARPVAAGQVAEVVGEALPTLPRELQSAAAALAGTPSADATGHADAAGRIEEAGSSVSVAGPAVAVPAPRTEGLPPSDPPAPIGGDTECFDCVAALLEGVGDGADLPRVVAYLRTAAPRVPDALSARAVDVLDSVWDAGDCSPRQHLAALVCALAGVEFEPIAYRGFRRHVYLQPGEVAPPDWHVEESSSRTLRPDRDGGLVEVARHEFRSGYRFIPTHAPSALLVQQIAAASPETAPLPPLLRDWTRAVVAPGEGPYGHDRVIGDDPKPTWLAATPADGGFAGRALDVSAVGAEHTFRVLEAREQDGYEQIAQWAAWLLADNPDTLAAQFHPVLCAATHVVNVRGVAPLLDALGDTRQPPGPPTYSALALAASARQAPHRALAAEAISRLAASGLLSPVGFAREVAAHLADGFVMAGRVAQTLADAATISALAGYRTLQTLAELLAGLIRHDGRLVPQAGKLVDLAAGLAADYGTPVAIPDVLRPKRKGASALAVALRALESVTAHPTALAREAADEAAAARPGR